MNRKELARISKALSDPARLRIYQAISSHPEIFCGELVKKFPLTPGTISHHLKILAEAKLIECRREGQFVYNRVKPETIYDYTRALTRMATKTGLDGRPQKRAVTLISKAKAASRS